MHLLFVCTGNICRSPTAEGVMRHLLDEAGLDSCIRVDSAGTHAYHCGEAPDLRSIAMAQRHGICLKELVARTVRPKDFHDMQLILAMDRDHLRWLERAAPKPAPAKVALFLEYAGLGAHDVPDPYYGGTEHFERTYKLIYQGCEQLLARIMREH